ncbi:MAG: MerR family DNA-binding protein [Burkholderiaceae bacterium]|nr:MerR family DNA-binding protein [Burkholderiaceae bacterium]
MSEAQLTIGRLAQAAEVGIETVRYYQQRKLLPVPAASGAYRRYDQAVVQRIRFIKRAQELGFSLDEINQLLRLQDGGDRRAIRRISSERLAQIENKLVDLKRMQRVLKHLVAECKGAGTDHPCPIIEALTVSS